MDIDDLRERMRFGFLRSSTCTPARIERRRREVLGSWERLRAERRALELDKRAWFDASPRPVDDAARPFCFVLERMKLKWRKADRLADTEGRPVDRTVGSTRARQQWFDLLSTVLHGDQVIRVRHRYWDEPAVLMRESRYRALEGWTPPVDQQRARPADDRRDRRAGYGPSRLGP